MPSPGQTVAVNGVEMCCECEKSATKGIIGECDSFGYEVLWYCEEHYRVKRSTLRSGAGAGCCDWCGSYSDTLVYRRDVDEGSSGRVYEICQNCVEQ